MSGSSKRSALFVGCLLLATEGGIPLPLGVPAVPVDAGNDGAVGITGGSALGSTDVGVSLFVVDPCALGPNPVPCATWTE